MLPRMKSLHEVYVGELHGLCDCHRWHADYLMLQGDSDRARKELEEDLDLVRSVPVAETALAEFALCEALTLAALGRGSGGFTPHRSPTEPPPAFADTNRLEACLAEIAARRIGWLPTIVKSPSHIPEGLSNEAWVDRVMLSIKTDAREFHIDHTRLPSIGWRMRQAGHRTLGSQRRAGKLGDAHRIADQFLALAERLTRSYPDQAVCYMFLSEGYVEKAKNAYREDSAPVIESWEQKALEAAIQALKQEPENDQARDMVKNRRARLNKLASK
jgi:hypothetical protein